MAHYALNHCLCCGSDRLKLVLDLQTQPPANLYTPKPEPDLFQFPLCLNRCENCWHSQLSWNVDRQNIFDEYAYVSGTSKTLTKFFSWFASALKKCIGERSRVLEIAANDGSLIQAMQNEGLECIGVDPAIKIVESARLNGLPLLAGYWPQIANELNGKFDAIIAMNVLAHVDQPLNFLSECKKKLNPNGIIVIQPSQARMFENGEFDTIYHEHISFFNSRSISNLATRAGLKLTGTAIVKVHGDSPIYFLQHDNLMIQTPSFSAFQTPEFGIEEDLLEYEKKVKLFESETYEKFSRSSNKTINNVKQIVDKHRAAGFKIAFVGAAAKAITLINAAKIIPDYLLDEAPLKIGMYAPGCQTLVEPINITAKWTEPTLFILSAWNFRFELAEKLIKIGIPKDSKFYSYFPKEEWINV
jgi:SAM-dependent methyltransferase